MTCAPAHASAAPIAGNAPPELSFEDQLFASSCRDPNINWMAPSPGPLNGFVYIVAPEGHDVCKIGSTDFMTLRLADLQCGAWAKLSCVGAVAVYDFPRVKLEMLAHRFAATQSKRLIGEWFAIEPQAAVESVVAAARHLSVRISSVHELFHGMLEDAREQGRQREVQRRVELRRKLGMD